MTSTTSQLNINELSSPERKLSVCSQCLIIVDEFSRLPLCKKCDILEKPTLKRTDTCSKILMRDSDRDNLINIYLESSDANYLNSIIRRDLYINIKRDIRSEINKRIIKKQIIYESEDRPKSFDHISFGISLPILLLSPIDIPERHIHTTPLYKIINISKRKRSLSV